MNTAEIVIREVQGDSGFEMRKLLTERIREPRKTPHRHSHGQVLPFHKRRADMVRVGVALSNFGYNPRDAWWGVPPARAVILPEVAKQFGELGEVYVRAEALRNGNGVVVQSIRGELHAVSDALIQVPQESPCIGTHALANAKRRHQLGLRVNGNVNPLVAKFGRISASHVAPFLSDVAPDFINLQIPGAEVSHPRIHDTGAAFASNEQEPHDRVAIQSGQPFGATDRATLNKAVQSTLCGLGIRQERVTGESSVRFGKSVLAGSAFPALSVALAETPGLNAVRVLASNAGHVISPLCLSGMTCYHEIASEVRVAPRFGLSGISGSSRRYRVYIYRYGGRISCLLFVIGPWILCSLTPTNHGPFADLPAKSSLPGQFVGAKFLHGLSFLPQIFLCFPSHYPLVLRPPLHVVRHYRALFCQSGEHLVDRRQRIFLGERKTCFEKFVANLDSRVKTAGVLLEDRLHGVGNPSVGAVPKSGVVNQGGESLDASFEARNLILKRALFLVKSLQSRLGFGKPTCIVECHKRRVSQ